MERKPWTPNFNIEAEWLLRVLPVTIKADEINLVQGTIAQFLQGIFIKGLHEARERLEATPPTNHTNEE